MQRKADELLRRHQSALEVGRDAEPRGLDIVDFVPVVRRAKLSSVDENESGGGEKERDDQATYVGEDRWITGADQRR